MFSILWHVKRELSNNVLSTQRGLYFPCVLPLYFSSPLGGLGISLSLLLKIFKTTYITFGFRRKIFILSSKTQNSVTNTRCCLAALVGFCSQAAKKKSHFCEPSETQGQQKSMILLVFSKLMSFKNLKVGLLLFLLNSPNTFLTSDIQLAKWCLNLACSEPKYFCFL